MAPSVELPQKVMAALAPAISSHTRDEYRRAPSANDMPAAGENVNVRDEASATTSAPSADASADASFAGLLASVLGDGRGGYNLSALAWEAAAEAEAAVAAGSSSGATYENDDFDSTRSEQSRADGDYAFLDGRPRGLALLEAAVTGPAEAAQRVAVVGPGSRLVIG